MTRVVTLFEDGTALVDGLKVDALGADDELPFLTEEARLAAARGAMADGDRDRAERVAERGVVAPTEDPTILAKFVGPPDWDRFGEALWDDASGTVHPVFTSSTMLVGSMAVQGCVGRPFVDDTARRECATWCLRNGLDELAERVAATPVGGDGPHCTWPDADLPAIEVPKGAEMAAETERAQAPQDEEPVEPTLGDSSNVVQLFGGVLPQQIK